MKPFDLELAKKSKRKYPLQTANGRPARIVCYDKKDKDYPIIALVDDGNGKETSFSYTVEGKLYTAGTSNVDLFMAELKEKGWINIYRSSDGNKYAGKIHPSKEEALKYINTNGDKYLSTTSIEYEL